MQAIITKYYGPTNTKPSRIKATNGTRNHFVAYNYELSDDENHAAAARALIQKLGWYKSATHEPCSNYSGIWQGGSMPDGSRVFVMSAFVGDPLCVDLRNA